MKDQNPIIIPVSQTSKGITEKIKNLKVGEYFLADKKTRSRFSKDFKKLKKRCATRIDPDNENMVRVYRIA
jgi:hypothetical protein